jgi:CubicO group peptidase (beta-lactamase class C family)
VLESEVFSRAGLKDTQPCSDRLLIPHRAHGYTPTASGFRPADLQIQWQFGFGGGLCSTARDLLTWTRALESGRVVSSDSYRRMTSGTKLPDGSPVDYGYGLSAYEYAGHRVIAHSGHVAGFSSHLSRYPDADLTIAVLTNTDTSAATLIEHQIADLLLGVPPVTPVPVETETLAAYAGTYGLVEGETVTVEPTATGIKANVYGRDLELLPTDKDTFATSNRMLVAHFVMDESAPVRLVLDIAGLRLNFETAHPVAASP